MISRRSDSGSPMPARAAMLTILERRYGSRHLFLLMPIGSGAALRRAPGTQAEDAGRDVWATDDETPNDGAMGQR